jgi:hypothetical protein
MHQDISPDKLEQLQGFVRRLRDKEREVADLEERLKQVKSEISTLRHRTMPELFYSAHVDRVGLPAEGNRPAVDAVMDTEYKASIPANWPQPKREAAFKTLDELDLRDLQKIIYTVTYQAGRRAQAEEFGEYLTANNIAFSVARSVHHASLSAALREICQKGKVPSLPQLEAIGGFIGDSVNLKVRKE